MRNILQYQTISAKIIMLVCLFMISMGVVMGIGIQRVIFMDKEIKTLVDENIPLLVIVGKIPEHQFSRTFHLERAIEAGRIMREDVLQKDLFLKESKEFYQFSEVIHKSILDGKSLVERMYRKYEKADLGKRVLQLDYELRSVDKELMDYQFLADRIINMLSRGKVNQVERIIKDIGREEVDISRTLDRLLIELKQLTTTSTLQASQRGNTSLKLMILIFVLVLFGCFGIGLTMARALSKPIRQLVDGTRKIARGDLSMRLSVPCHDEIGELAQSFNHMTSALDSAIQKEKKLAAATATAAAEKKRAGELEEERRRLEEAGDAALNIMEDVEARRVEAEAAFRDLSEKTRDLERFHQMAVGRELRMTELKAEVNELLKKQGEPERYRAAAGETPETANKTKSGNDRDKG